ncbi:unnamed protein product [Durusdinium trenchii]|uniref:Uncharacterized protein n=1 Tax=Durusdinium trenchii TaxID=1381693 RepID=A0ABP0NXM6_9DINO
MRRPLRTTTGPLSWTQTMLLHSATVASPKASWAGTRRPLRTATGPLSWIQTLPLHSATVATPKTILAGMKRPLRTTTGAIELDPNFASAFRNRGNSKHSVGKYEEAIEDHNKAIELKANDAIAFRERGNSKHNLGRYEEAIEDFNRAIELDPNYAMSFCMRGSSVRLLGNHEAAIRDLDKALELEPENALFFRSRGDCKQAIGKHEAAIEDYNLAIELNRDDVIAVANRSFSECAQRKLDKPPIDVELVWLVEKLKQLQKEVNQPIDCLLKQVMEQTSDFVNSHPNMQLLPSQLDPTFECDGTSGSFSVCSLGSWIDVGSQGCCCFLPDTYFTVLMEDGEVLTPARRLFQGANVVAANGRTTEVTFPPEQHQVHAVIELQAGDAFLVVSPDHRILVPGNVTVQAQDLHVGSEVILDGNLAALTSLKWKVEPTIVLKIGIFDKEQRALNSREAVRCYSEALELSSELGPSIWCNRALAYLQIEEWQAADADTSAVLASEVEEKLRVKALYRRALAREALGRFEEAEVDANLALKAAPGNVGIRAAAERLRQRRAPVARGWVARQPYHTAAVKSLAMAIEGSRSSADLVRFPNGMAVQFHQHNGGLVAIRQLARESPTTDLADGLHAEYDVGGNLVKIFSKFAQDFTGPYITFNADASICLGETYCYQAWSDGLRTVRHPRGLHRRCAANVDHSSQEGH